MNSKKMDFHQVLLNYISSLYPHKDRISLSEPIISKEDKNLVLKALDQNMISSFGPQVSEFENKISHFTGLKHVIAIINGTAALHLSMKALNIRTGDEVLSQAYSYIAVPNAIQYTGAKPVFIDNDSQSLGMSANSLEKTIIEQYSKTPKGLINKKTGNHLKAVIAVYAFGQTFDIKSIHEICKKYNLYLIEDAAEALGTFIDRQHAGSFGDIGVLSFNGNKICSSGAGGAIICNNSELADKIRDLSTTAKTTNKSGIDYKQLGYNYKMPNINASLGLSQLDSIQDKLKRKLELRRKYQNFLRELDLVLFGNENCNNWLNSILLNSKEDKRKLVYLASESNIQLESSWVYVPDTTLYKKAECHNISCALDFSERIIQLPGSLDFKSK